MTCLTNVIIDQLSPGRRYMDNVACEHFSAISWRLLACLYNKLHCVSRVSIVPIYEHRLAGRAVTSGYIEVSAYLLSLYSKNQLLAPPTKDCAGKYLLISVAKACTVTNGCAIIPLHRPMHRVLCDGNLVAYMRHLHYAEVDVGRKFATFASRGLKFKK